MSLLYAVTPEKVAANHERLLLLTQIALKSPLNAQTFEQGLVALLGLALDPQDIYDAWPEEE